MDVKYTRGEKLWIATVKDYGLCGAGRSKADALEDLKEKLSWKLHARMLRKAAGLA